MGVGRCTLPLSWAEDQHGFDWETADEMAVARGTIPNFLSATRSEIALPRKHKNYTTWGPGCMVVQVQFPEKVTQSCKRTCRECCGWGAVGLQEEGRQQDSGRGINQTATQSPRSHSPAHRGPCWSGGSPAGWPRVRGKGAGLCTPTLSV